MEDSFSREVRPLLDLVDKLRELGVSKEVSLPQIAVMGDQSSGKSSVLQSISGIPFPRGSGLVTRCPLELIMKKSPENTPWTADVSIRWDKPQPSQSGVTGDVLELTKKIEVLSDLLAADGTNGFSEDCILVKVTSPDAPDLTLIDLPGIVRTSTRGQEVSVIDQVNCLIEKYISMPNTIILAVIPSNQDIATIDILERAARVDPDGVRTLGVLTKPDLIGPGNEEEVLQVLLNQRKPLRLGYIMLKNFSQKQLNDKVSPTIAKIEEIAFFQNHPFFSQYLEKNIFGTEHLTQTLTKLLVTHIKKTLPHMKTEVKNLLLDAKKEFKTLCGEGASIMTYVDYVHDINSILVKKIHTYCHILRRSARGEYRERSGLLADYGNLRLHGQITPLFHRLQETIFHCRPMFYEETLTATLGIQQQAHNGMTSDNTTTKMIENQPAAAVAATTTTPSKNTTTKVDSNNTQIIESSTTNTTTHISTFTSTEQTIVKLLDEELQSQKGRELPGFLNTQVFTTCMIHLIEEWRTHVEDCLEAVIATTMKVTGELSCQLLKEYPLLQHEIDKITKTLINGIGETMQQDVEALICREQDPYTSQNVLLEVVNTIRFRNFDKILRDILDSVDWLAMNQQRYLMEEDIKMRLGNWYMRRHGVDSLGNKQEMIILIQAYWDIASRRFIDNVCMCIEREFLFQLSIEIENQCTLFGLSLSEEELKRIMQEDETVIQKRTSIIKRIELLQEANELIGQIE